MNHFTFDASWKQLSGVLKQKYAQLTDDDLQFVEGKGDELLGRLQARLGRTVEEIESLLVSAKAEMNNGADSGVGLAASVKASATEFVSDVKSRTAAALDGIKEAASAQADQVRRQAGNAFDEARERAKGLQSEVETYVRESPRQAIVTAILVGFFAGILLRR